MRSVGESLAVNGGGRGSSPINGGGRGSSPSQADAEVARIAAAVAATVFGGGGTFASGTVAGGFIAGGSSVRDPCEGGWL